jgi:Mrp family chromosome partitioning ATPase
MDRTRIALDKARRRGTGDRPVFSVTPLPTRNVNSGPIEYRRTRTVELDSDVLYANRVVAGMRDEPLADVYRILRTQVLKRLGADGLTTFAVCSPNAAEGKTLTAVNLALSLAMDVNQTILLVELDLRKPSLAKMLGISIDAGIDDYLEDRAELADCLINPGVERLVILPVRGTVEKSSELLASPKMQKLAQELKNRYPDRLVMYDLPPLLATDDCLAFLPNVDATLFVAREGVTTEAQIERSLGLLKSKTMIGTILNGSRQTDFNAYL